MKGQVWLSLAFYSHKNNYWSLLAEIQRNQVILLFSYRTILDYSVKVICYDRFMTIFIKEYYKDMHTFQTTVQQSQQNIQIHLIHYWNIKEVRSVNVNNDEQH
jgi:hypothetical protein